jgi:thioredoxin-like negative regulator of GroEL
MARRSTKFMGAQPESAVRQFSDRVIPSMRRALRREARDCAQQDTEGSTAVQLLHQAAQLEPNNELVLADLGGNFARLDPRR